MARKTSAALLLFAAGCGMSMGAPEARTLRSGPDLSARIDDVGAVLSLGGHEVGFRAVALGREGSAISLGRGAVSGEREEVRRVIGGGVVEWWRTEPRGLEHGVTIADRPRGEGELELELELTGAEASGAGEGVVLTATSGERLGSYDGLAVLDARGTPVPATLAGHGGSITIRIDDADAVYPIVVDPLLATIVTELFAASGRADEELGAAVAMSADGQRVLVGASLVDSAVGTNTGAALVFVRTGTSWALEATLTAATRAAGDQLGRSVALSDDGSVALVGAINADPGGVNNAGDAVVFRRTGTSWTEESVLVASGAAAGDGFGWAVALSGDGLYAFVAGPSDDTTLATNAGTVRVFFRGATWTEQATLAAAAAVAGDGLGTAVAASVDGTRVVIGAYLRDPPAGVDAGSALVFSRAGTVWTREATFSHAGAAPSDRFGISVALSDDGSRALVGASTDTTASGANAGSVRAFTRSGTAWTEDATIVPSTAGANETFGAAIGLSADGARTVIGAPYDDTALGADTGTATSFTRSGTVWSEETTLAASDGAPTDWLGAALALSGDGSRVAVGAYQDDVGGASDAGSVRILVRSGTTWTEEATLVTTSAIANDELGRSVAITPDGTRALVGMSGDDPAAGVNAGSVRVYLRTGSLWVPEATLLPPDAAAADFIGWAVAITPDGALAFVGMHSDDNGFGTDAGSVRVFSRAGTIWSPGPTLAPAGGSMFEQFGYAVAVTSDASRVVIGAPGFSSYRGRAQVWVRTGGLTWAEEATLLAGDGVSNDDLGFSVAISSDGSRVLLGARRDATPGGSQTGSVRVFSRAGSVWSPETTLTASTATAGARLGSAIALTPDGTLALVGAPEDDTAAGNAAGSVRVFARTGTSWSEAATLLESTPHPSAFFGSAVGVSDDGTRAIVGAERANVGAVLTTGSAHVFSRAGTVWTEGSTITPARGATNDLFGHAAAIAGDGSFAIVGGHDADAWGANAGRVVVVTLIGQDGDGCGSAAACASGLCVDGVCCATACAGGPGDCQACSVAAGGTADGTCTPMATAVVCRASTGPCDPAETCSPTSTAPCPADALEPSGTVCNAARGPCDSPEGCTGLSAACPGEVRIPAGIACRASAGACDVAETCTGLSDACPPDGFLASTIACRTSAGPCDPEERCTGTDATCPADALLPVATVCAPASAGVCDADDVCTGTSALCAPLYAAAGTECMPSSGEICDTPDVCAGTSADCVATFVAGVECRAAVGGCDAPEFCTGADEACPPDAVEVSGMACRVSTDPSCDPAEVCDGVTTSCPADVISCLPDAGTPDASIGPADAGGPDGGAADSGTTDAPAVTADAGSPPPVAASGCACRARSLGSAAPCFGLLVAVGAVLGRRR